MAERNLVTAIVPDEEPAREPTVCFNLHGRHLDVPFEVMRWFTDQVEEEIRTSRAWMRRTEPGVPCAVLAR
ncbi:hypothetical protein JCM4914_02680 [Streptomyces platensis subsp. malvinus]